MSNNKVQPAVVIFDTDRAEACGVAPMGVADPTYFAPITKAQREAGGVRGVAINDVGQMIDASGNSIGTPVGSVVDTVTGGISLLGPSQIGTNRIAGRRTLFGGDSITNGSSASNFAYSFSSLAVDALGGIVARNDFIEGGTPGDRSYQLLARLPGLFATYPDIGHLHIQIGTNDAIQLVTPQTYLSNLLKCVNLAKTRGIGVSVGTIPPLGSGKTSAQRGLVDAYNLLIRLFQNDYGYELAEVHGALVDTTTGYLSASYNSGDDTHPNDLGHSAMSQPVAQAISAASKLTNKRGIIQSLLQSSSGLISSDPLQARASVTAGGWYEQPGGTGTAPTYSFVSDTSGKLPAGRWSQMDFDATASGGTRRLATAVSSGFSVGDKIAICVQSQIEDVSGNWEADNVAGTAALQISIQNQSAAAIQPNIYSGRSPGLRGVSGVYDFGSSFYVITIPAGTTQLLFWHSLKLPTGSRVKMRIGCAGILNLTTMGLASVVQDASAPINT